MPPAPAERPVMAANYFVRFNWMHLRWAILALNVRSTLNRSELWSEATLAIKSHPLPEEQDPCLTVQLSKLPSFDAHQSRPERKRAVGMLQAGSYGC